ncbi:MAG: toxin-antitoxin system HicB family antitoxin [Verrucomicrobia bacterium]|nr:toxin-antitoxin system HicB family antitoxin [Verrucomicrobiota bacterium]
MTTITVQIPDSILNHLESLAEREGFSVSQFASSAVSEKLAVFQSLDFLKQEAEKGSVEEFQQLLKQIPNAPPLPGDEM